VYEKKHLFQLMGSQTLLFTDTHTHTHTKNTLTHPITTTTHNTPNRSSLDSTISLPPTMMEREPIPRKAVTNDERPLTPPPPPQEEISETETARKNLCKYVMRGCDW
jgi:hypothetical protein